MVVLARNRPMRRRRIDRKRTKKQKQFLICLAAVLSYIIGFALMGNYFHGLNNGQEAGVENLFMQTPRRREQLSHERKDQIAKSEATPFESPLLIFTCQRANYLSQTLDDIYRYIPRPCSFGCPIVVSQDGDDSKVAKVISEYIDKFGAIGIPLVHIRHTQSLRGGSDGPYGALAKHYKWALEKVFHGEIAAEKPIPQRVMILEEDIHTAPDFFSYMEATSHVLDEDKSLFAVSAFNDNGHQVNDPTRVLRTDFFPGLGWMMTRSLWQEELESKWPEAYWDDWLREPAQRKGRQVIRPEISRTYHFGFKGGASHNQFGSIIERVVLNEEFVDWNKQDLSFLKESNYDEQYMEVVRQSKTASNLKEAREMLRSEDVNVVLRYLDFEDFRHIAMIIGIMDDEKAMVPRTAYKGIVETRPFGGSKILFLKPANSLTY